MDRAEIIWNLRRLIRDAFPKGLPVGQLPLQYGKYFQCQLPSPRQIESSCRTWCQVLKKSEQFKKWFCVDKENVITVAPIAERDLRVYFRHVRYTQYISTRQGAKHEEWSGLSESEYSDSDGDEESILIAKLTYKPPKSKLPGSPPPKKRKLGSEGWVTENKNLRNNEVKVREQPISKLPLPILDSSGLRSWQPGGSKANEAYRLKRSRLAKSKAAMLKRLRSLFLPTNCKLCSVHLDSDLSNRTWTAHYKGEMHFKACMAWFSKNGAKLTTWRSLCESGRWEKAKRWEKLCIALLKRAVELSESTPQSTALSRLRSTIMSVGLDLSIGNYISPSDLASVLRKTLNACNLKGLEMQHVAELSQLFGEKLDQIIKDFESAVGDCSELR